MLNRTTFNHCDVSRNRIRAIQGFRIATKLYSSKGGQGFPIRISMSNARLSATRWGFEKQGLDLCAYYKDKNGIVNPKEKADEDAISSQEDIKPSKILDIVSEHIFSTCPEERRKPRELKEKAFVFTGRGQQVVQEGEH